MRCKALAQVKPLGNDEKRTAGAQQTSVPWRTRQLVEAAEHVFGGYAEDRGAMWHCSTVRDYLPR
jgi:hypothetical protein